MIKHIHYEVENRIDMAHAEMELFALRMEYPITASIYVEEIDETYHYSTRLVGDRYLVITDN